MIEWNKKWGNIKDLGTHRGFVYDPHALRSTNGLQLGHVISFMYKTEFVSETTDPENMASPRLAFVMHPNHERKCHALTLNYIDRHTLLDDIYPHIVDGLRDPRQFYYNIYKPSALYDTDAYRTYKTDKMKSITQFKYDIPDFGPEATVVEAFIVAHPTDYTAVDRAVMYEFFKKGHGLKEVEQYYHDVVLKRPKINPSQQVTKFVSLTPADYTKQDRAVMYNFFKKGYGIKEVEEYYKNVVLKRKHK